MTKPTAAILGVATIGSALTVLIGGFVFPELIPRFDDPQQAMRVMGRVSVYSFTVALILVIAYMVYLFATPMVPRDRRALWFFVLLFGNLLAIPVFWYHYVWKVSGRQREADSWRNE